MISGQDGKRVLIADISSRSGLQISKSLAPYPDIRVVGIVSDLQDASRLAEQQNANIAILSTERLYGVIQILQKLKSLPGMRVIAMNGSGKFRTELLGAGADDFFLKPEIDDPGFPKALENLGKCVRFGMKIPFEAGSHPRGRSFPTKPAPLPQMPTAQPQPAARPVAPPAQPQPPKTPAAPPPAPAAPKPVISQEGMDALSKVRQSTAKALPPAVVERVQTTFSGIIAIGSSLGGTEATLSVLQRLPSNMPPIVVVQHMPPVFTKIYAERVDRDTRLRVKEAEDGDDLLPGRVLIAPGEMQMRVQRSGGRLTVSVQPGPKVTGHRPSVDVLFESVAKAMNANAIGIILTGMGSDGARGMLEMHKKGAFTIGQDQESAVVYGMPKVAFELGGVSVQASLDDIPGVLIRALQKK